MPYIIRDKNYRIHDLTPPHTGYNRIQHPHIRDEKLVRFSFFLFGAITDILAVALLAFALYFPNMQGLKSFLESNGTAHYLSGFYIMIVSAILMILISILGFWSVLVDGRPQLYVYQIFTTIFLVLSISGLVCAWIYYYAVRWSMSSIISTSIGLDSNLMKFQEDNKCCGFINSNDWLSFRPSIRFHSIRIQSMHSAMHRKPTISTTSTRAKKVHRTSFSLKSVEHFCTESGT